MSKVLSSILKAPLVILVIGVFVASLYVADSGLINPYATTIFLGILLLLYFVGVFLGRNKSLEVKMEQTEDTEKTEKTDEDTKDEEKSEDEKTDE